MDLCGRLTLVPVPSHLVQPVMPSRPTTVALAWKENPDGRSSKELVEALTLPFPLQLGQGPGWNAPVPPHQAQR